MQKREKPQKDLEIALCQKHTMSFGANASLLCGWIPLFHFHPTLQILTPDLTNLGFLVMGFHYFMNDFNVPSIFDFTTTSEYKA